MPLTSAFLAPPLDKKWAKQNLDGLNTSKASHIGLAFHSPPGIAPLHWEVLSLQLYVDVPWSVCRRALICLSTCPDMSVDVPSYVCRRALICLPTCLDMLSVDVPFMSMLMSPYMCADKLWYVCQRALICWCTLICWRSLICQHPLVCRSAQTCQSILICQFTSWQPKKGKIIFLKLTCQIHLLLLLTRANVMFEIVENAKSFCMPIMDRNPLCIYMWCDIWQNLPLMKCSIECLFLWKLSL